MNESWDPNRCNDRSGFLFSHDCSYPNVDACSLCARPICDEHTRVNAEGQSVCVSCAKQAASQSGHGREPAPRRRTRSGSSDHDPYFYGSHHYGGYGYYGVGYWGHSSYQHATHGDDANFTAGDSQSLSAEAEGGDEVFESDMSES